MGCRGNGTVEYPTDKYPTDKKAMDTHVSFVSCFLFLGQRGVRVTLPTLSREFVDRFTVKGDESFSSSIPI